MFQSSCHSTCTIHTHTHTPPRNSKSPDHEKSRRGGEGKRRGDSVLRKKDRDSDHEQLKSCEATTAKKHRKHSPKSRNRDRKEKRKR